jgi:hypothetical protein
MTKRLSAHICRTPTYVLQRIAINSQDIAFVWWRNLMFLVELHVNVKC